MPSSLGPAEILVILIVALIVLGPTKLPGAARQVGKTLAEVRRWSQGLQDEVRSVIDPDAAAPSYPPAPEAEPTPVPAVPIDTGPRPDPPAGAATNGHAGNGAANGSHLPTVPLELPPTQPTPTQQPSTEPPSGEPPHL